MRVKANGTGSGVSDNGGSDNRGPLSSYENWVCEDMSNRGMVKGASIVRALLPHVFRKAVDG